MNLLFVLICTSTALRFQESNVVNGSVSLEVEEAGTEGVGEAELEILSEDGENEDDAARRRRRRRRRRRPSAHTHTHASPGSTPSPPPGSNAERLDAVKDVEFTALLTFPSAGPTLAGKTVTIAQWCASSTVTDFLAKAFAPSVRTILTSYNMKIVTDAVIEAKLKKTIKCKSLPTSDASLLEASVTSTTSNHRVIITFPEDDWDRKPSTAEYSNTVTSSVLDFIWKLSTTVDTVNTGFKNAVANAGAAKTIAATFDLTAVVSVIQMTTATAGLTGTMYIQVRHDADKIDTDFLDTDGGRLVRTAVHRDLATTFSVPSSSLVVVPTKTTDDVVAVFFWRIRMGFTTEGAKHKGVISDAQVKAFWTGYMNLASTTARLGTADVFASAVATVLGIETGSLKASLKLGHTSYNDAKSKANAPRCFVVTFTYQSPDSDERDAVVKALATIDPTAEVARKAMLAMTTAGIGMVTPASTGAVSTNVALQFLKMKQDDTHTAAGVAFGATDLSTVGTKTAQYKDGAVDANHKDDARFTAAADGAGVDDKQFGSDKCKTLVKKCGTLKIAYTISIKVSALKDVAALLKAGKSLSQNYGSTGLATKFKAAVGLTGGYTVNEVHSLGLITESTLTR